MSKHYVFAEMDRNGKKAGPDFYGITPVLFDKPGMTVAEAQEALSRAYGVPAARYVLVREEEL